MEIPALFHMAVPDCLAISALLLLPCAFIYLGTLSKMVMTYDAKRPGVNPPVAPYWIPWIAHSLRFFMSPAQLAISIQSQFSQKIVRLNFFNVQINMISGSDSVSTVWKEKSLDSKPAVCIAMKRFFGTSNTALQFYKADNSGIGLRPHPSSKVEMAHRIYFPTHKVTPDFMTGPDLPNLMNRFQCLLKDEIAHSLIDENWTDIPDFFSFFRDIISTATVTAMCGTSLIELNPDLIQDLWEFDRLLPYFFKGYPPWLAPKAWRSRKKCLESLQRWQSYCKENFDDSSIEEDGHDRFYGTPLMRSRQLYFTRMPALKDLDLASENIRLIWAKNANSAPAKCWYLYEAMRDDILLSRVRDAVQASYSSLPSREGNLDTDGLCRNPLLQSMFAETLRLRTVRFIVRASEHEDINISHWTILKGQMVVVDTHTAHTDKTMWSTSSRGDPQPVEKFWPDRFLVYPTDPHSGPLLSRPTADQPSSRINPQSHEPPQDISATINDASKEPKFSLAGLSGSWVPFGGGRRQCPGRIFAKQEIVTNVALLCASFDIEFLSGASHVKPEPDMRYYGLGGARPTKKVPCRIRRRIG